MPIRTYILLTLAKELLEELSEDFPIDHADIQLLIDEFFSENPRVVSTENEGKGNSYIGAIRDMFYGAAQQMDEFWEQEYPDDYEEM